MKHLTQERKLPVAKISDGVYHINKETFPIQIIVTRELSPEDGLYLRCLTDNLQDAVLINRLADDYKLHQEQEIYTRYMHQVTTANTKAKGEQHMVCEGLLNLFGTSSAEIIERAKKESDEYYLPQINQLTSQNDNLSLQNDNLSLQNDNLALQNDNLTSQNSNLASQNAYLKSLLAKHNIPFDLKFEPNKP